MELRLTFAPRFDRQRDVLVRADGSARVAELARALADHDGSATPARLTSSRSGPLDFDQSIEQSGLRDGDIVSTEEPLGGSHTAEAGALVDLVVVGGPGSGRRLAMRSGEAVLGRDPSCELHIDDPSLSRRHARFIVDGAVVHVEDAGSSNGTSVEGEPLGTDERRALKHGQHVEVGRSLLEIRTRTRADETVVRTRASTIDFNPPPRMAQLYDPPSITVRAPPVRPGGARLPFAASLAPLVLGVAMFALTKQPTMLLFSALSPVMAMSTFLSDRRGGRRAYERDLMKFRDEVRSLGPRLGELREREVLARRKQAPDPATIVLRAVRHLPELWERRRLDADFMSLRVGMADQPAMFTVEFEKGGEPHEREQAQQLVDMSIRLPFVPILAALPELGAIGLSGNDRHVDSHARWLVAQATVLHSPRDLLVFAGLSADRAERWRWLRWLPHASASRTTVDHANVAIGEGATSALLNAVSETISVRRAADQLRFAARDIDQPYLLVVMDEQTRPPRAVIADLLRDAAATGLGMIWLGSDRRELPGGCGITVDLNSSRASLDVAWPREGRTIAGATADGIGVDVAEEIARGVAPIRDVTAARASAAIPRRVALLEILDLSDVAGDTVARMWSTSDQSSLSAPIGRSAEGPFIVDLRVDGPHGLVAGTTGAGKSELLQTLVASLALAHPPDRLSFLFVDYKGGAAFKDCVGLAHTVGMVTDLDAHLTRRALLSLNAELRRREEVLHDAGARDLLELARRSPKHAPPALLIVIDEFAALKTEVPEFVDGVVDIAQRGRSLGVHLLLATQRPGGIVSENIRANTNLRIALRVQNPGESDDVIGDHAAARISKSLPGRGYARTGHSDLTEFQSAFVGGYTAPLRGQPEVTIEDLDVAASAGDGSHHLTEQVDLPNDLIRIVAAVSEATDTGGISRPRSPWLPALDSIIETADLEMLSDSPHVVALGRVDEPSRQRQRTWGIDLERDGHAFVFGTSGSGKTTLLRTIGVQLARRHEPRHLHVYGMDFAGHGLAVLAALPHCGAVITGEDEERVARLFLTLRRELEKRGRLFAAHGVTTLSEYAAVAGPDAQPPRIVVLLDSYSGFTSAFEKVDLGRLTQALPQLIADGRAAGIHIIATADRRMAVPAAVLSLVPRRIVLRLADDDEYGTLGLDRKAVVGASLPPGRGFVDDTIEIQTAIVGGSATAESPAAAIVDECERLRARFPRDHAPPIAVMPDDVRRSSLPAALDPAQPIIGIEEIDLEPALIDLREASFFVCGPYRTGRTTALATLACSIRDSSPAVEMHALLPRRSALAELDCFTTIARGTDACVEAANRLRDVVLMRSSELAYPLLAIFVDDCGELADGLAAAALEALIRRGRDVNVRIIASCEIGHARGFSQFIREMRKETNGLLLDPSLDLDGELLGVRLPRKTNPVFPPGRGYLVRAGIPVLAQVARDGD